MIPLSFLRAEEVNTALKMVKAWTISLMLLSNQVELCRLFSYNILLTNIYFHAIILVAPITGDKNNADEVYIL